MFVAKNELKNAWQLTRIRLKNTKRNRMAFFAVVLITLLGNIIPLLVSVFRQSSELYYSTVQDFSVIYMVGILIAILVMTCNYRETDQLYSVYPQTNTSRFLSSQAIYYLWVLCAAAASLFIYLVEYAVFAVLAGIYENIVLVYTFNLEFVIAGFFVLIVYAGIALSIITLTAVLIRKFKIYAMLISAILLIWIITNFAKTFELFKIVFGGLIFEENPAVFIGKGILLWLVLFSFSFIVNKYTVYYKSNLKISKFIMIGIAVIGVILVGVSPFLIFKTETRQGTITEETEQPPNVMQEIIIDASDIPPGSKINIVTTNIIDFSKPAATYNVMPAQFMELHYDEDILSNFKGQKIIIYYDSPVFTVDDYKLSKLVDPKFSARLEGNTLYLDYSYIENVKAIFNPVWSFMWQFDCYKGKGIFKESAGSSYGGKEGMIFLSVE